MKNLGKKIISLAYLPPNREAKIISVEGGFGLRNKLRIMGARKGRTIKIVSKQPLRGPITITVNGSQITLGRGMTEKIMVEIID